MLLTLRADGIQAHNCVHVRTSPFDMPERVLACKVTSTVYRLGRAHAASVSLKAFATVASMANVLDAEPCSTG
jgi:hypothetical protein